MGDTLTQSTIVRLLALGLGDERALATWNDAVRGLGMSVEDTYPREKALSVLVALSGAPGSPGLAARVARERLESDPSLRGKRPPDAATAVRSLDPTSSRPGLAATTGGSERRSFADRTVSLHAAVDLLPYLVPSLGDEKAREALQQYGKTLGVNTASLSRDDAIAVLDAMSSAPGLLGVVARFAKARFLLKAASQVG